MNTKKPFLDSLIHLAGRMFRPSETSQDRHSGSAKPAKLEATVRKKVRRKRVERVRFVR